MTEITAREITRFSTRLSSIGGKIIIRCSKGELTSFSISVMVKVNQKEKENSIYKCMSVSDNEGLLLNTSNTFSLWNSEL